MIYALVLEKHMLHMAYSHSDSLVAVLDIVVVTLLVVGGNMRRAMPRKLDRKTEVADAIGRRGRRANMARRIGALQGVVCHGDCGGLCY